MHRKHSGDLNTSDLPTERMAAFSSSTESKALKSKAVLLSASSSSQPKGKKKLKATLRLRGAPMGMNSTEGGWINNVREHRILITQSLD